MATANDMKVARTIANQMGGTGRLSAMLGANQFVAIENGLQFRYKMDRQANTCQIILDASDTYTMKFWKCSAKTCKEVASMSGLFFDQLQEVFTRQTGLDTHL